MRILARRLETCVAERLLDEVGRGTAVEGVAGVGVAEEVRRDGVGEPGPLRQLLNDAPELLPRERPSRTVGVGLPGPEDRPVRLGVAP